MRLILPLLFLVFLTSCDGEPNGQSLSADDLLRVDDQYKELKCQKAWDTFELAKHRLETASATPPFAHYVAVFDALSIAEAVRADWLQEDQRRAYLEWREQAERELIRAVEKIEKDVRSPSEVTAGTVADQQRLQEALRLVEKALEEARQENLTLIDSADPNGLLQRCLEQCARALSELQRAGEKGDVPDIGAWEEALKRVNGATTVLRNRQLLKYSLWAERIYRVCTEKMPDTDTELERFYIELARIDVGLVQEPALARGIALRMHELYEKMTAAAKTGVRYKSIMQLDARRRLEEF